MSSLTPSMRSSSSSMLSPAAGGVDGSAGLVIEGVEADTSAGGLLAGPVVCCFCGSSVACLALSTASAILAGQVGSRGEWRRTSGVVEKSWTRSREASAVFILLAHAVQLDVVLVLRGHVSA